MIAVIGVLLMLTDSITISQQWGDHAEKYLRVQPWKRLILGDGLAILGSFASYYLDRFYTLPVMPRFTYLFIYYIFLTFNLITFGYFFGGSEFSFNTKFGVLGLYTYTNFVNVFYVSIMLGTICRYPQVPPIAMYRNDFDHDKHTGKTNILITYYQYCIKILNCVDFYHIPCDWA